MNCNVEGAAVTSYDKLNTCGVIQNNNFVLAFSLYVISFRFTSSISRYVWKHRSISFYSICLFLMFPLRAYTHQ